MCVGLINRVIVLFLSFLSIPRCKNDITVPLCRYMQSNDNNSNFCDVSQKVWKCFKEHLLCISDQLIHSLFMLEDVFLKGNRVI